jgi:cytoskeleton protein RodZ
MGWSSEGFEEMFELGSSLREARGRRRLGLVEVAEATMIRVRYLEALENERFDLLPEGPYRRSFLREYADFLGLDGEAYAAEYELRFIVPEPEPPPSRSRGVFTITWLGGLSPARAAAVAAVAALLGVGVWQLSGSGGTGTVEQSLPSLPQPRTEANPEARARPAATANPPARRPPVLVLSAARGPCWLVVRIASSTGRIVYEQMLQPGQTVRFGLRKPLWIRFGAPWNLDATIGARQVTSALPSRTGDTFATATGLRSAA